MDPQFLPVTVYHPDPLPGTPLPVLIMTNGAGGQEAKFYGHILQPLAEMGFIVASVQSNGEVEHRAKQMACTLRWLRKEWNFENQTRDPGDNPAKFNCDLVLMGHSRGGAAAFATGNSMELIPWDDINFLGFDMKLRALIGIAPRFDLGKMAGYTAKKSVPFLAMMGSTDDDVPGQAITAYDHMVFEASKTADDPGKLLLWPYDVPHNAFGGFGFGLEGSDKGRAIAAGFVPRFLDLFVMGNEAQHEIFTGEQLPPEVFIEEEWWSYLDPAFTELGGPVIPRDFVVDQRANPGSRQSLDDFEGGGAFSSSLDAEQTLIGLQSELADPESSGKHFSEVLKVNWGGLQLGGNVTWELDNGAGVSLADFSFFSLRVGQELLLADPAVCALPAMDPRRDALTLNVRLEDSMSNIAELPLGPIIQQDARIVESLQGNQSCAWNQFMQTLRLPMDSFCQTGFDIESVVSLTIEFPDLGFETGVFMDTLEFTRHPLDDAHLCI